MAVSYEDIYKKQYKKTIGDTVENLKEAEGAGLKSLKTSYDATEKKLTQNRDNSLKQAYISKMKEEKEAPALLARQGLNGGYSESAQASITRNYQNNRTAAENNYQDNMANAQTAYNSDVASLKATYADAINSAKQNAIALATSQASNIYNAALAEEQAAAGSGGSGNSKEQQTEAPSGYINTGTVTNTPAGIVSNKRQTEAPAVKYTYRYENGTLYRVGLNANGRPVTKTPVNNQTTTGHKFF